MITDSELNEILDNIKITDYIRGKILENNRYDLSFLKKYIVISENNFNRYKNYIRLYYQRNLKRSYPKPKKNAIDNYLKLKRELFENDDYEIFISSMFTIDDFSVISICHHGSVLVWKDIFGTQSETIRKIDIDKIKRDVEIEESREFF